MSYPGSTTIEGPFLQGLSTSDIQDTWTSDLVTFTATNNVATLDAGYVGDWRLAPSFTSTNSNGRYESRRPNSSASTYALHGNIVTWVSGSRFGGDESLINPDSNACGYYTHGEFDNGGVLVPDYSHCTTICELIP